MTEYEIAVEQLRGALDAEQWLPMLSAMTQSADLAQSVDISARMLKAIEYDHTVGTVSAAISHLLAAAVNTGRTPKAKIDVLLSIVLYALTLNNVKDAKNGKGPAGYGLEGA